jgi:methionine-rich copper-binding protein CopC
MTSWFHAARPLALFAALTLIVLLPAPAAAHAELVRAIPADGETVTEPVTVLSGRYSEDLTGNSRLEVLDASGTVVATGGIDPEDPRRMIVRPDPPLIDGTYTVRSTAVSASDGHPERATWTFTVAVPATPSPTPLPTATPSAAPSPTPVVTPSPTLTPAPSPTPTASPDPGSQTSGTGDVLLPILAALAIVAVGAGFLLRRGRPG